MKGKDNYEDLLGLPHHQSSVHSQMSMAERAAQFSPFAALTGHREAIRETARQTSRRRELTEDEKQRLDEKLQMVRAAEGSDAAFTFTYFVPDERKDGGSYALLTGRVKKIEEDGTILLENGRRIEIEQLVEVDGNLFW